MKNIWKIVLSDYRRLTKSVVSIIVILGLTLVPCLYAWFNIMSNWDPYEPEATGNIPVAVVVEDEGAEMLGLSINVGEKVKSALEANNMIGWRFMEKSEEAVGAVRSGSVYAALVIPKDFTEDILSFVSGELNHPKIIYYENVKKNAIAPKITGKAKNALMAEIDATFVDTIGQVLSEAATAAEAAGLEPGEVFDDLGDKMADMSDKLEESAAIVDAAFALSEASGELLDASDDLLKSSGAALETGEQLLANAQAKVPSGAKTPEISNTVKNEAAALAADCDSLSNELSNAAGSLDSYNDFVDGNLSKRQEQAAQLAQAASKIQSSLNSLGFSDLAERFGAVSAKLSAVSKRLGELSKADEDKWDKTRELVSGIRDEVKAAGTEAAAAIGEAKSAADGRITGALASAKSAISDVQGSVRSAYGDLSSLSNSLAGAKRSLSSLEGGLDETSKTLMSVSSGSSKLAKMFYNLSDKVEKSELNHLLSNETEVVAANLASPMRMKTEVIYPVANNGSASAAFYTVLAQWVGALLAVVLIHAHIEGDEKEGMKLYEQFFGRYRLFLAVGVVQGLVVSLGDLYYIGIQCKHPGLFVLAACINGAVFFLINYAIVFALDKVGLAAAVIILVLQVAGTGGTFPVEVLPKPFQILYPFLPFKYALGAMRECIAGMYRTDYWECIGMLLLFGAAASAFGMLMYRPMLKINVMVRDSLAQSDVML